MEEAPLADANNNGILDDDETAAYKSQAASGKFKQQLAYGVGAAMVFGLFTAISQSLFRSAFGGAVVGAAETTGAAVTGAAAISVWPIVGLVAIAALGIGCLYLSAKFLSENTLHDQELQARQIQAVQGRAPGMAPEVEIPQPSFPSALPANLDQVSDTQSEATPEKKWTDKFSPSASSAAMLSNARDDDKSWGEKVAAAKAAAADPAVTQTLSAL
ncbi:MAG: hypothetical protein ACKVOE_00860 [Rickettsiales bacterium]